MATTDERPGRAVIGGYAMAVVACAAAVLVQYLLQPILGDRYPLVVFTAAVAVSAWSGGSGPGLLATLIAVLVSDYLFLNPRRVFQLTEVGGMIAVAIFGLTGVIISLSTRRLRSQARTERDARAETERLLQHAAHMQDLASALSRANTPDEVIKACLVELVHASDANAGAFALATDDGTGCQFVNTVGFPEHLRTVAGVVLTIAQSTVLLFPEKLIVTKFERIPMSFVALAWQLLSSGEGCDAGVTPFCPLFSSA